MNFELRVARCKIGDDEATLGLNESAPPKVESTGPAYMGFLFSWSAPPPSEEPEAAVGLGRVHAEVL